MKIKNKNALYWVWLAEICKPASRRAVRLINMFGTPEKIFKLKPAELLASGIVNDNDRIYAEILMHNLQPAEDIISWCDLSSVKIVTPDSNSYPVNFLSLIDAPLVLYVLGELPDFSSRCSVSIVGTRKMTKYGATQAFRFGYALGKGGAVTVSGLALGVDGLAMASAIEGGGTVVGIIGSGVDKLYPKDHAFLFKQCIRNGAVISEYAPGTSPSRQNFPQRNRLISALSQGTVIIEGDIVSGAMITARHALYQGKDLFALPGSVDSELSAGPNSLIKEGAFAVTSAHDVLERYDFIYSSAVSSAAAFKCLVGVDAERSADKTAAKYRTHGTLRSENEVYYGNAEGAGDNFAKSSVVATSEPPAEFHTFENMRNVPTEKKTLKTEKTEKAKRGKDGLKNPLFKAEKTVSSKIDFSMLSETDLSVYAAMIPDTPMLPDEIIVKGLGAKDIMSSLTLLEISGAVEAGAAGYYMRNASDEISEDGAQ